MIEQFYDLSRPLLDADERALALCREQFARLEEIKEYNQLKMLKAFTDCRVGGSHLVGTTGYGMDDAGRGKLEEVFAVLTGSEAALFRHNFMSGTHTLSVALFGVLRPGDRMVAVTGRPYDTLAGVIGIDGTHYGNLMEFGVQYDEVDLLADGTPDLAGIARKCRGAKMCYIQRSRGYAARPALSLEQIEAVSRAAKAVQPDIIVMVDNCYGEFTQKQEPTQRGADLMAGSLIKIRAAASRPRAATSRAGPIWWSFAPTAFPHPAWAGRSAARWTCCAACIWACTMRPAWCARR